MTEETRNHYRCGRIHRCRCRSSGIAGAALVIGGLSAKGFTTVSEIGYINRGYEEFEKKLRNLGGEIKLVNSEKEAAKFKLKDRIKRRIAFMRQYLKNEVFKISKWVIDFVGHYNDRGHWRYGMAGTRFGGDDGGPSGKRKLMDLLGLLLIL